MGCGSSQLSMFEAAADLELSSGFSLITLMVREYEIERRTIRSRREWLFALQARIGEELNPGG